MAFKDLLLFVLMNETVLSLQYAFTEKKNDVLQARILSIMNSEPPNVYSRVAII